MVFAFRPDSRATLRKLTPISLGGVGYGFALDAEAGACFESREDKLRSLLEWEGRASARTLSRGKTSAERLRDLRKARREEDKWNHTFRVWLVLRFAAAPYCTAK